MPGNLGEWCNDWKSDNYYAESPKGDPQGPAIGIHKRRVMRGGSFYLPPANCRSAFLEEGYPGEGTHYYGVSFRVFVALSSKTP